MTNPDKNEERMNALTKAAAVLTKLFEIAYSIGAVSMAVVLVLFLLDPYLPGEWVWGAEAYEELTVQGFSLMVTGPGAQVSRPAMVIFLVTGGMVLELMAWVFRDANLILRTTQGLTKFSQGKTPFQKDNVRMMREIGIFFLAIAVVELAASSLAFLILGPEFAEVSINAASAVTGILMLCLSQVFALGMQMQKDVDGLV